MTSGSETSRTRTSRACFEDAADAAVSARSRLVGRGELLMVGAVWHLYGSEPGSGAHLGNLIGYRFRAVERAGRGRARCGTGRASGCIGRPRQAPGTG